MKIATKSMVTAWALSLCGHCWGQAVVTGKIEDSGGKPINEALVVLNIQPAPPPAITRPYYGATLTKPDGSFRFEGVPEGQFSLCSQATGTKLLNPCEWGGEIAGALGGPVTDAQKGPVAGAPIITVKGTAAVETGTTKLEEGYLLRVEILDAQGIVANNQRRLGNAFLTCDLRGLGRTLPMRQITKSSGEVEFFSVVPFDVDLDLTTSFNLFEVADEEGLSAVGEKQLTRRLRFAKSDAAKPVKIRVSGVKAQ